MRTLVVGFDSAWTRAKTGAIVGAIVDEQGNGCGLGLPRLVQYADAVDVIADWQTEHAPMSTLVLLDQPTIVVNDTGQRPVEQIVCSAVSRRRGAMQPGNRGRADMFGTDAPVWEFLSRFGGATDPFGARTSTQVLETYPVLVMISLGWTLPDPERAAGRLAKYNPVRRKTFAISDWAHVCRAAAAQLFAERMMELATWLEAAASNPKPTKSDQDCVDACICLIAALHTAKGGASVFIGNGATGYILVPDSELLRAELTTRCRELARNPSEWIRVFHLDLREPNGIAAAPPSGAAASNPDA